MCCAVRKMLAEREALGVSRTQTLRQKRVTPGLGLRFSSKLQLLPHPPLSHLSGPLISPAPAYLWPPSSGTTGSGTRIEAKCLHLTFLAAWYQS